ncbi:MAG: DUF1036 domain-containing protein [Caulobacterales bacterium]|nr:DUF1036 domain-containing protein [Caulobacterales bacterium]
MPSSKRSFVFTLSALRRRLAQLALAAAAGLIAGAAHAEWTLCNHTSYVLRAAIAYPDGTDLVSEGWLRLRPNECRIARSQRLTPGAHYFYARASRAHRGGMREWAGDTPLCANEEDFSIRGARVCEGAGLPLRLFVPLEITETRWRTTVEEPERYNAARAGAAGLQRLLRDSGYEIASIDGYSGRRTVRAINQFMRDSGLSAQPPAHEMIDLLEAAALNSAGDSGLRLCNRSDGQLWTAIAMRRRNEWESRGWWPLAQGQCATVIDEPLEEDAPTYVYASLKAAGRERPLAAADETFCLADTKFAILGRVNCIERGYLAGRFLAVPTDGRTAVTLDFGPEDFDPLAPTAARTQ